MHQCQNYFDIYGCGLRRSRQKRKRKSVRSIRRTLKYDVNQSLDALVQESKDLALEMQHMPKVDWEPKDADMEIGCYTTHLYCDNASQVPGATPLDTCHSRDFPQEFTGETRAETRRKARAKGWLLNDSKPLHLCPQCHAKRKTINPTKESTR